MRHVDCYLLHAGSSMEFVMQTLAALHTTGWGTVAALGPQMQLINSTWWDNYLTGFMSELVPAPFNATGSNAYMGQVSGLGARG